MKSLKLKQKVRGLWYPDWGIGKCVKVLKTRWCIEFSGEGVVVFDKPHLQFLEEVK